jgi:WD40 repeat protein
MARGLTTEAVAREVAEQLGLGPCNPDEVVQALQMERAGAAVVVDAVDEAADPAALMRDFVIPATQAGTRVAIGALVGAVSPFVGADGQWCDVSTEDVGRVITAYVVRRLCSQSDYDRETAQLVAAAVAQRADGLFIAAELMARTLAAQPPIDTKQVGWQQQIPSELTDAFRDYLGRFGTDLERVLAALHPLACARGAGLTLGPAWLETANALREEAVEPIQDADLRRVCRAEAADYLIQSTRGEWRLYHDGLGEAIRVLVARERVRRSGAAPTSEAIAAYRAEAAGRFADALVSLLPTDPDAPLDAYAHVDGYVLRHLPGHLADLGRTTELYRPGLLLAADQDALQRAFVLASVTTPAGAEAARVAVVHALAQRSATPAHRAAALVMALRRQSETDLAERVRRALDAGLPYELIAGPPLPPVVSSISRAHANGTRGLAVVENDGAPLVISGGSDGAVRSWWLDGRPGPLTAPAIHADEILAVEVAELDGRPLVITGAKDGALRSCWLDARPGPLVSPEAHSDAIRALVLIRAEGVPAVVSFGFDGSVQLWPLDQDPVEPTLLAMQTPGFGALAAVEVDGAPLLVTGDVHGALRSWWLDGRPGPLDQPQAHGRAVIALAAIEVDGEPVIVSAGLDATVRNWVVDGRPGPVDALDGAGVWSAVFAVAELDNGPVLVSGGYNGVITSWWPNGQAGPLAPRVAHNDAITSMAVAGVGDASLLVTGGSKGTLRTWRLVGGGGPTSSADTNWIRSLAIAHVDGAPLVISGGSLGALRSRWMDGSLGPLMLPEAHEHEVTGLAVVEVSGVPLVVSASSDGVISSWWLDGRSGPLSVRGPQRGDLRGFAVVEVDGSPLFVSGGVDGVISSWWVDGRAGPLAVPAAGEGVTALAVAELDGSPLVITGDSHGTLRSWRIDGQPGPLTVPQAHSKLLRSLAVGLVDGAPLVISGGDDGLLQSWWLDGRSGPIGSLEIGDWIWTLAAITFEGEPLIISGNGGLRTLRVSGEPGPLNEPDAHPGGAAAVVAVEVDGVPLIVSGGGDGTIVARRLV